MVEPNPDPPTWEGLLGDLGLKERTLAHHLLDGTPPPQWAEEPEEFRALATPSTNASAKALLMRAALSDEKQYFLTVVGGTVVAAHGLTEAVELKVDGGKFVTFLGDVRHVSNQVVYPDLYDLPTVNSRSATALHFVTRSIPTQEWDEIVTELEQDGGAALVERAGAPEEGGDPPETSVHLNLPVPATIAALFLTPTTVRSAFGRGQQLRGIIPEGNRDHYAPLFDFLRGAVTQDAGHADRSALQSAWVKLVIGPNTRMEERYFRMVGKLTPSPTPPPGPAPPVPPNPPQPPTGGGGAPDEKSKYHEFQCRVIWSASGKQADTFAVQTEASMPAFFQGLKEHRGNNAAARLYIESAWNRFDSPERIPTPFVWSPVLIKDLRNLDFGGGDIAAHWDLRGRGLSYYSLGPPEQFISGRYVRTADDWRMFEDMEVDGNLTLEERKKSRKAGELLGSTPKDRMSTVCHLEAVSARFVFLLTEECPVVVYLNFFASKISQDPRISTWGEENFLAFNWQTHVALRKTFTDCTNGIGRDQLAYLMRIQSDLSAGRRFSLDECPPELRSRKREGPGQDTGAEGGPPPKKEKNKEKKKEAVVIRLPIADNFSALVKAAREGTKAKAKWHLGKVLASATDYKYVLGPDLPNCTANKNPCGRAILCGCNSKRCPFDHEFISTPSRAIIEGVVNRLREKVDAYVAVEAAKE